jgi:hypothetical protein
MNFCSVILRHCFNCSCHIQTVEIRWGTIIITDESDGEICYFPILKPRFCTLSVYISQSAHSTHPIVVSDWNWVTAKRSVTSLINLIREQRKISETQEVKYVTMVKTRHLNGSRPFAYLSWESACAGSGMQCSLLTKRSAGDVPSAVRSALSCSYTSVTQKRRVGKQARVTRRWVLVFDSGHVHFFTTGFVDFYCRWCYVAYRIPRTT